MHNLDLVPIVHSCMISIFSLSRHFKPGPSNQLLQLWTRHFFSLLDVSDQIGMNWFSMNWQKLKEWFPLSWLNWSMIIDNLLVTTGQPWELSTLLVYVIKYVGNRPWLRQLWVAFIDLIGWMGHGSLSNALSVLVFVCWEEEKGGGGC